MRERGQGREEALRIVLLVVCTGPALYTHRMRNSVCVCLCVPKPRVRTTRRQERTRECGPQGCGPSPVCQMLTALEALCSPWASHVALHSPSPSTDKEEGRPPGGSGTRSAGKHGTGQRSYCTERTSLCEPHPQHCDGAVVFDGQACAAAEHEPFLRLPSGS